jgi:thiol-disulfide isomerase/thioredoxin
MMPVAEDEYQDTSVEGSTLDSRKVMLVGAVLVTLFGGLAVWSLLTGDSVDVEGPDSSAAVEDSPANDTNPTTSSGGSAMDGADPDPAHLPLVSGRLLDVPRKIPALLGQRFQHWRSDGTATFNTLRGVLSANRGVAVINVWATWCEPCKNEFPGFRELQKGWGDNVYFVPIQLGKDDPGSLRDTMPAASDQLVDYIPGGVVSTELAKLGELPPSASIPITMLLDCKMELRWVQQGEVKDMQALDGAVQTLREELRTAKVRGPPAVAAAADERRPRGSPRRPP